MQLSLHLKSMARFMAGKYVQVGVEEGGGEVASHPRIGQPGQVAAGGSAQSENSVIVSLARVERNGKTSQIAAGEQSSQEAASVQPGQVKA